MDKGDVIHTHTHTYNHTHMDATQLQKNNEKFAICSNMDDLEDIMLSEISQRKTNAAWYHLYVESKKYNKLVNE